MTTTSKTAIRVGIIDYGSGNIGSVFRALQELHASPVLIKSPTEIKNFDRLILPGVGNFLDCANLLAAGGWRDALREEVLVNERGLLGICVGMQLMATQGKEYVTTPGLDWIAGDVVKISPREENLKIPHMGWNTLDLVREHPVLERLPLGDKGRHAYFVHSYHLNAANEADIVARANYGGPVTAIVAKDTTIGTQFHPEKSQRFGLALISNFLKWKP